VDVYPVLHDAHVALWLEGSKPVTFQLYGTSHPLHYDGDKGLSHRLIQALASNPHHKQHGHFTSRSHTAGLGVMLVAREDLGISSIGVDIEAKHRKPPSQKLIQRVCPSNEEYNQVQHIPPLGVWCIKEALFKAWPNNKGGVLAHITIQRVVQDDEHSWHGTATPRHGERLYWMLQSLDRDNTSLWCAMTWCKKQLR
jgi:hypothetical protein